MVVLILLSVACNKAENGVGLVDAFKPVYMERMAAEKIVWQAAQPIVLGGKIATLGNYLFMVEQNKGIHIIDYSNAVNPIKIGFIQIMLCNELAVKNNFIYTNNINDLVVIEIKAPGQIEVTSRVANAFPGLVSQYPPETNCYFECYNSEKGVIIEWEKTKINNPNCKR